MDEVIASSGGPPTDEVAADLPLPSSSTAAGHAPVLLQPVQPPLWPGVTIACSVLLVLGIGFVLLISSTMDRSDFLDAPEEYLEHVMGRDLDANEYADHLPDWQKYLETLAGGSPDETVEEAIRAYRDYLEGPRWSWLDQRPRWPRLQRTLAILLAEADRMDQAETELESLSDEPAEAEFVAAVRFAYGNDASVPSPARPELIATEVYPAWARDKLFARIAEQSGDADQAEAARARLVERGKRLAERAEPLVVAPLATTALGLLIVLAWSVCGFPRVELSDGLTVTPWSFGRGYAVLVRGAVCGLILAVVIGAVSARLPILVGFATLLSSLPLLWFGSRYLLRPWNQTLASCFGLVVPLRRWGALVLFTMALSGVDMLGSFLISAITTHLGSHAHWAETVLEDYLWKPWYLVALDSIDGVLWAPIFEEIGCRGFLYTTMRRGLPALPAALLTGILFGAAHMYSLPGFLLVSWSGFLWSLAYERSRSLTPGILTHSIGNLLALGGMIMIYRI